MIEIDGSLGEGGGQVLRTSLALSIITRQPFRIINIREHRSKPGLMAQHLKSVDAATAISKARIEGAKLYSDALTFTPSEIRSGRYRFDIGTAGAASLVLQTILIPLSLARSASSIIISGGTHVPWSPSFDYLSLHWLYYLQQIGFDARISLEQAGFYPKGGGRINAAIRPAEPISPLHLTQRGNLQRITGISAVANLPLDIAERQKRQAVLRIKEVNWGNSKPDIRIKIENLRSPVKGTILLLLAQFEGGRSCYFSLGKLGKPAERVADEAVDALDDFMKTDGVVDQYLVDQLLVPLSLSKGESEVHTSIITSHILTNAEIIRAFMPVRIFINGEPGRSGTINIKPV
jgi:RNA 3'-terminal phosphate cyclase (ATP)